jgi:uncharacterized protein
MDMSFLHELLQEQRERFVARAAGTPRAVDIARCFADDRIVVISGVRRCGKSTLMRQMAAALPDFHFINFDDERLIAFTVADFSNLTIALSRISRVKVLLADEIQNVEGWERFVRRLHDEGWKVVLTGSNAHLLSSELATHLTGRYRLVELYPFSFTEFLSFNGFSTDRMPLTKRGAVLDLFDEYLEHGGFPEYLKNKDDDVLKRTYDDVVYRDIINRFRIKESRSFRELSHYLFTNFTGEVSYASMKNRLRYKSPMTVANHVGYLAQAYLVFELFKYDHSLKKQHVNNKKIYVIDNGMRNAIAFRFSKDVGKLLENMVLTELRRRSREVYYHRERQECDFLVREKQRVVEAIQVTYELNETNRIREFAGLTEAMRLQDLKSGTLLTHSAEGTEETDAGKVHIVPVWRWLIGQS